MSNQAGVAPAPPDTSDEMRPPKPTARLRQPALRVLNGEFGDPPAEWQTLDKHRDDIQAHLPSVGRIRQGPFVLGTGVLVARNVVLTAGHVARAFSTDIDSTPKLRVGWSPVVDFIGELPLEPSGAQHSHGEGTDNAPPMTAHASAQQSPAEAPTAKPHDHVHQPHEDEPCGCCKIRSVFYIDEHHDLALLRVAFDDSKDPGQWRRPRPLALNASYALIEKDRPIYLIGFPTDDRTATPGEVRAVLGMHFGVKRVQPGVILNLRTTGGKDEAEFEHDASTLKGNSGSCVVDLATNQLIGLHTRGSREAAGEVSFNRAIAFARLPSVLLKTLQNAGVDMIGTVTPPPQTA